MSLVENGTVRNGAQFWCRSLVDYMQARKLSLPPWSQSYKYLGGVSHSPLIFKTVILFSKADDKRILKKINSNMYRIEHAYTQKASIQIIHSFVDSIRLSTGGISTGRQSAGGVPRGEISTGRLSAGRISRLSARSSSILCCTLLWGSTAAGEQLLGVWYAH